MVVNRLLLAGLISVASVGVCADYMFEVDGSLGSGEITEDSDYSYDEDHDTEATNFSAQVYFGKVSSNGVPIREAGFLSKKSSVILSRNEETLERDGFFRDFEISRTELRLSGRFVLPNPNIILGLGYFQGEIDFSGYDNYDLSGYSADIGLYVSDSSAILLSYETAEIEDDYYSDIDESTIKATYKHVAQLGSSSHLAWQVEIERAEEYDLLYREGDRSSIGGSVVWYLNPKLSFGAGLRIDFHDLSYYGYYGDSVDATGAVFTPRVSYDINENIGFYAKIRSEVMIIEDDGYYDDEDADISDFSTTVGITARF